MSLRHALIAAVCAMPALGFDEGEAGAPDPKSATVAVPPFEDRSNVREDGEDAARRAGAARDALERVLRASGIAVVARDRVDQCMIDAGLGAVPGPLAAEDAADLGVSAGVGHLVIGTLLRIDDERKHGPSNNDDTDDSVVTAEVRIRIFEVESRAVIASRICLGAVAMKVSRENPSESATVIDRAIENAILQLGKDAGFLGLLAAPGPKAALEMPGRSFSGTLAPLSDDERAIARELRAHVDALAVKIGIRRAVDGDSLHRAEAYARAQLMKAARDVPVTREPIDAPGDPANLVLELPGEVATPLVIIGAHYDTAPGGTPGANDNATGAAAALVLASRFARAAHRLPIRVVLFANEEPPYFQTDEMGSLVHAKGCRERGEEIRAMFALETMGYYSDEPGSQRYPSPIDRLYPDRGNFIAFVGDLRSRALVREAIGLFRSNARFPSEGASLPDALSGIGWSDHWSFWQCGYSGVMVTDTATFRDPNYHETSDVIDHIDFDRLARVVEGLRKSIEVLADT